MAGLSEADLLDVRNGVMRDRRLGALDGILKDDLAGAINGLNNFFAANEIAINAAIPQPARANLTVKQKALLVMWVMEKRYLVG